MNVANRHMTTIGRLPQGDPANIVSIDARDNMLTEIPEEATSLPNLKILILDKNAITHLHVNRLVKMRSLTALSLQVCIDHSTCLY